MPNPSNLRDDRRDGGTKTAPLQLVDYVELLLHPIMPKAEGKPLIIGRGECSSGKVRMDRPQPGLLRIRPDR